jgi:hypothetical protein
MTIDVSKVVVPYRSIARLLDRLESTEPLVPTLSNLESSETEVSAPGGALEAMAAPLVTPAGPAPHIEDPTAAAELDDFQRAAMLEALGVAAREIARADRTPGVLYAPDNAAASLLLSFMAKTAIDESRLEELPNGAFEAKFDDGDFSGWIWSFLTDWVKRLKKRPFLGNPNTIAQPLGKNDVRIAILGDWGTNLYGAPRCAGSILETNPAYDVVLHLGDVYYAGTKEEVKARFLDPWPRVPGARYLALNSNHEMYAGGEGYFDLTLPDFKQASSFFAYQTDHFVLVGLDTGYHEHDLAYNQAGWLQSIVANAADRKVILFSHHQPFSLYETQGLKLQAKLGSFLTSKRIFAWYWAHEHRCVIYDTHPAWGLKGRCIGHSGYPSFRKDLAKYPLTLVNADGSAWRKLGATNGAPGGYVLDGANPYVSDAPNKYGPHGYASLELSGPHLVERVYSADRRILHERQLA